MSNNHDQANAIPIEIKRIPSNPLDLDSLDIKIMRELLDNPNSSSSKMVRKLGIPLSTIQRRRTRLESSVLTRKYELSSHDLGWRNAEILMLVEKGKADSMAKELIEKFDKIIGTSTRINTTCNLAAYVGFRKSYELHELLEKIRAMPNVRNIEWSEIVRDAGNKTHRLAQLIFNSLE